MTKTIILPRRQFLKNVALTSAAVSALPLFNLRAEGTSRKFKVGLVGCGGRGKGATENLIEAAKSLGHEMEVYSVVDFFPERANDVAKKYNVPADRTFSGATGYLNLVTQPVDIVILATPPAFRPAHFEAAINAGKHVLLKNRWR